MTHKFKFICKAGHVTEQLLLNLPEAPRCWHKPIKCIVCGRKAQLQKEASSATD